MDYVYVNHIVEGLSRELGIHPSAVYSGQRRKEAVWVRQLTWLLFRDFFTLGTMGEWFPNRGKSRDYSTVLHGVRTIQNVFLTNPRLKEIYDGYATTVRNHMNDGVRICILRSIRRKPVRINLTGARNLLIERHGKTYPLRVKDFIDYLNQKK